MKLYRVEYEGAMVVAVKDDEGDKEAYDVARYRIHEELSNVSAHDLIAFAFPITKKSDLPEDYREPGMLAYVRRDEPEFKIEDAKLEDK